MTDQTCPGCDGKGQITEIGFAKEGMIGRDIDCPDCNGTGHLNQNAPKRLSCDEVHPQQDVYHPDGHDPAEADNQKLDMEIVQAGGQTPDELYENALTAVLGELGIEGKPAYRVVTRTIEARQQLTAAYYKRGFKVLAPLTATESQEAPHDRV